MSIYDLDPFKRSPMGGVFPEAYAGLGFPHPGVAGALRRTCGYEPFVVTTATPGEDLKSGIVFCCVKSWLTGNRPVSLPLADHCQEFGGSPASPAMLLVGLMRMVVFEVIPNVMRVGCAGGRPVDTNFYEHNLFCRRVSIFSSSMNSPRSACAMPSHTAAPKRASLSSRAARSKHSKVLVADSAAYLGEAQKWTEPLK